MGEEEGCQGGRMSKVEGGMVSQNTSSRKMDLLRSSMFSGSMVMAMLRGSRRQASRILPTRTWGQQTDM